MKIDEEKRRRFYASCKTMLIMESCRCVMCIDCPGYNEEDNCVNSGWASDISFGEKDNKMVESAQKWLDENDDFMREQA